MIDFPENVLPYPQRDYYASNNPRLLVQRFEVGTRQRKRFSDEVEIASITWQCNITQWKFLKTFISNVLFQGAEKFQMSIPTVDGLKKHTVQIIDGSYGEQHFTGGVDVSVELEIIDPLVLTGGEYHLILISDGNENYASDFVLNDEALHQSLVHYSTF